MSTERRKRMDGFSASSPRSLVPLVPKLRLGMRPAKLCFANPGVTSADIERAREAELPGPGSQAELGNQFKPWLFPSPDRG